MGQNINKSNIAPKTEGDQGFFNDTIYCCSPCKSGPTSITEIENSQHNFNTDNSTLENHQNNNTSNRK